jgi:hypothetical protein
LREAVFVGISARRCGVKFFEQPPSKQWAALKYRGVRFAEVWFKPQDEPFGLTFRIPRDSYQIPGMRAQLTLGNLLKAVSVAPTEVEAWRLGDGLYGTDSQPGDILEPPAQDATYLDIHVRLKPPPDAVARGANEPEGLATVCASGESEISQQRWQDLENRWRAILNSEAIMETMRISMEGLLAEMESLWKKPLTMEEKTYAPRADVGNWNKAKIRVHNALPKMKDFVRRFIGAMGSPERKRLEQLYNDHIQPHVPFPQIHDALKQLEELRKDRQVLSALGKTVYLECKGISSELQQALRTLQTNTVNAKKKKGAGSSQGRK